MAASLQNPQLQCLCSRKRKEHDEFTGAEVKFSKASADPLVESPVLNFIQKWRNNDSSSTKVEISENQKPSIGDSEGLQKPRHNSCKENQLEKTEQLIENSYNVKGRFVVVENDTPHLTLRHLDILPVKRQSSKPSPRRKKSKQLSKKISALESRIETSEEEYERRVGYRPSYADKMNCEVLGSLISEQTKLKKELKEMSDESPRKKSTEQERTIESERDGILARLARLRLEVGRPVQLDRMTADQMAAERRDLQSQLGEFERDWRPGQLRGREKEVMTDLYERLRQVRRRCRRQSNELVPIPEEEALHLQTVAFQTETEMRGSPPGSREVGGEAEAEMVAPLEEKWHDMNCEELKEALKTLKQAKTTYKRTIKEFEIRRLIQEDDARIEDHQTFMIYKETKSKIKLMKALIEKQINAKSII